MTRDDYLKLEIWHIREAAILLLGGTPINDAGFISSAGLPPLKPGEPDRLKVITEAAHRAIDAGTLSCIGKPKRREVRPEDFCQWAAGLYELPADMQRLITPLADDCDTGLVERATEGYEGALALKIEQAKREFPGWGSRQRKVQRSGNLKEWLKLLGCDEGEVRIITKILTESFPDSF